MLKACSKCKVEKPYDLTYFRPNKHKVSGVDSWCRQCAAEYRRVFRDNNPPKEWNVPESDLQKYKDAKQLEECIICGEEAHAVDHQHSTGRIRGRLCTNCNLGIGHFKDDPELLELAALYLKGECACGSCEVKWGGGYRETA